VNASLNDNTYYYSNGIIYLKTTSGLKSDCLPSYQCCSNEARYRDKLCQPGYVCTNRVCVLGAERAFGWQNIGTTDDELALDKKQLNRFQSPQTGTITKLTLYSQIYAGTPKIRGVIYADSGGVPDGLLGYGDEVTVPASWAWLDLTGLNVPITAGTNYWIGYIVGISGSDHIYDKVTFNTSYTIYYGDDAYSDGPSNPAGSMTSAAGQVMSVYATYTSG
jgi:hypothetical protein